MTKEKAITIDLQLDNTSLKNAEKKVTDTMSGLQYLANNLETALNNAFAPDVDGMQNISDSVSLLTSVLACATIELQNLTLLLTEQHEENMWTAWYSDAVDSLALMVDLYAAYQTLLAITGALTVAGTAQSAAWTIVNAVETVSVAVTSALSAAMTFLTSPIGIVLMVIAGLIALIVLLVQNWDTVSAKAQEVWGFIQGLFAQFDDFLQNIFAKDFTEQFGAFGHVLNAFFANVENIWNAVKSIFGGIVDFVKNVFAGDWGAAWDSIVGVFKGVWDLLVSVVKAPINGIIGLINMLIASVYSGIADVVNGLGSVVSGVGDMLGLDWGFSIPTTPPQIPYLAKGAVLPANRPFLAMVGDQRHGTNIEAPLATIQEAVALVMDDYAARNAAGQQATVEMLRNILEAVLGIQIGDDVIGRAALRYNRKMAVAKGGF